ncbi:WD40 repeat domain-containing serine/threonine protein kinase [Nocardiopsis nanhaiensis]
MEPLHPDDPRELGSYRLLRRVGEGGMGVVFLAVAADGQGDDLAAVKAIRPEYAGDREFRARFASEVDLARRVRGPYTARVLAADAEGRQPWLATEYVPGPELDDAVRDGGVFPEDSLRALAAGLAEALSAIHGVGLIHRDLKPSNVLLSQRGPQVIDFGIARAADATALTRTGQTLGTPGYMSPEQATGAYVGPRSDLFAFGGVLLFAATGRQPFGTGNASALLYRVVNESPDLSGVPDGLLPLVTACLAKDPGDRPDLATVSAELTGTALPVDGEGTTEWLPQAVATKLLHTMAATRITPTGALNQEPTSEEELPSEEAPPAEEPAPEEAVRSEEPSPDETAVVAEEPTPKEALSDERGSPEDTSQNGSESVPPPDPARTVEHGPGQVPEPSSTPRSGPGWLWGAAAAAVLVVVIALVTEPEGGTAPSAGSAPGSYADTESTPSASASPSASPTDDSEDVRVANIRDTAFLGDTGRFAVLATAGVDVFETGEPEPVERLTDRSESFTFSYSELATTADGSRLASKAVKSANDGIATIHVWDLEGDEPERHIVEMPDAGDGGQFALSPDGGNLYFGDNSADSNSVRAFDVGSGEELYSADIPEEPRLGSLSDRAVQGSINGVGTSADGELLVAALDTGIAVWDAATGEAHPAYPELRQWEGELYSPPAIAGDVVVTNTSDSLQLWDIRSDGDPEELPLAPEDVRENVRVQAVSLTTDGDMIAAAGRNNDRNRGFLKVWDREGEALAEGDPGQEYHSVSIAPGGDGVLASFYGLDEQGPEEFVLLDEDLAAEEEYTVPSL